jgi:c-di-GMP-binding flagellar brake protein YcgR
LGFFSRKKPKQNDDARQHYRRAPGRKAMLGAKVLPAGGEWTVANVVDASAGGAGLSFAPSDDPKMESGEEVTLAFNSVRVAEDVLVPAVVRMCTEADDHVRYGFQFKDLSKLFEGLDPFYLRFFNRRRYVRVQPQLGRNVEVDLRADDGGWRLRMHDISQAGISVKVTAEELSWVQGNERFDVELKLPGTGQFFRCYCKRVYLEHAGAGVRCGLEFELPPIPEGKSCPSRIERLLALDGGLELKSWIEAREDEMTRWDSAYD